MAIFNKFFTSRKNTLCKNQDHVSEKLFAFNAEQVRIVLFRECDFRGRKLLFDSSAVKKVPLPDKEEQKEKYAETSNGFGYLYTKPQCDFNQLAEMVFGSVAMSFRGTYFKIHTLTSPHRLMFTQVFPSPRYLNSTRKHDSLSSRSCQRSSTQSLEHSIKLDDSGASSVNSLQLSVHSTASDTVLIRRRLPSKPLDVPLSVSNPSVVGDSGYCGVQSCASSVSSGPLSVPLWEALFEKQVGSNLNLSGSFYKRLLRSTSTSLEHSGSTADDCYTKPQHRNTKLLGLAFLIELTVEQEDKVSKFLMEHVALLESLIWRTRLAVEQAYNRPHNFISSMVEVYESTARWLVNLLSGPHLATHLWHSLSNGCDNRCSISAFSNKDIYRSNSSSALETDVVRCIQTDGLCNSFNGYSLSSFEQRDFTFFNLSRFFKTEWDRNKSVTPSLQDATIERFLKEFCETIEAVDVKDTNFFMSTLITAVLTHHLGWVSTCLPSSATDTHQAHPYNCLWGQLSDLYGAVGHPMKMAQTIVTGSAKMNETISKILNCLTYFIRSTDIERRDVTRLNIDEENRLVTTICNENSNKTSQLDCNRNIEYDDCDKENESKVIFVLGDNEELVGLNSKLPEIQLDAITKPGKLGLSKRASSANLHLYSAKLEETNPFKDSDFIQCEDVQIKASTSWSDLCALNLIKAAPVEQVEKKEASSSFVRSASVPPEERPVKSDKTKSKYKYSGVKFNLQQYPQIVTNYMKSKNLELTNLPLGEKFGEMSGTLRLDFSEYGSDSEEVEALQTPSNASELEFTSDLCAEGPKVHAKEASWDFLRPKPVRRKRSVVEDGGTLTPSTMHIINLPMPKSLSVKESVETVGPYTSSILRGLVDDYVPDMVLQGTHAPPLAWSGRLLSDLQLSSQHSLLDQPIDESVAIVANTDTWEVQLMSSHTYVIAKGASGVRMGMSQLVANMLESLLQMWKLHVPPQYCLMHIEQKLQELCIRSQALAQLLLASEFCSMEALTSTLHLEVNDVPLLMAVASTHTPQVTQKYGLSFQ